VQWPDRIKGASKRDIDDWLKLVASKIKRAVEDAAPFPSGDEPEEEETE
jgi:hypothetical protein